MHFTLHQLRVFAKVCEYQSVTRASEALFLTQPAVSIQLKKFQEQFQVPLTEVISKRLYVTDFGKEVLLAAQKILDQSELIEHTSRAHENELVGQLKISVASTGKYVMPYFLSNFMQQHRGVDLVMDVTNKTRVIESLEKNEVDFALVSTIPSELKIHKLELIQNKLFLVGSPKLEQNRAKPKRKIFEENPLMFREQGSATRQAMEEYISKHELPVYKRIELTSNEALKQAVVAGLGYSIMPLIGIKNELKNKTLEIIPFKGLPILSNWHLIWLKEKRHLPVAHAFLEHIKEEKNNVIQQDFNWYEKYQ